MAFVLDSCIAVAWCFEDEANSYVEGVLAQLDEDEASVPGIWPLEVANALCVAERRRRLKPADTHPVLRAIPNLRR